MLLSIKNHLKKLLNKIAPKFMFHRQVYNALIVHDNTYLHTTGWMRSMQEHKPVDKNGTVLPWMNYAIIHFLKKSLNKNINLFEYGSGYSTLFYANLVKTVTSVEYDKIWMERIKKTLPENAKITYQQKDKDGRYCRTVNITNQKYDVVIIDGRDRINCIKQSIESLSEFGVIILDDSQRERYKEGIEFAIQLGFRSLDFEGLKPTGLVIERTTILYRNNNCLNI